MNFFAFLNGSRSKSSVLAARLQGLEAENRQLLSQLEALMGESLI